MTKRKAETMTRPDGVTLISRAFNTPLMLDPAKAAVIAPVLARRLPDMGGDADMNIIGLDVAPEARHSAPRDPSASLLGDEVHFNVSRSGRGYSIVQGVAVIPIVGSLVRRGGWVGANSGMTSYEGINAQLRAAASDDRVRAIALEIDSFGGEAHGIFDLGATIRAVREAKPVHAFLADHALSAGYAIASQASTITVPPFGYAGSIGVVCMHMDVSRKLDQEGVTVTLIHSGAKKVEGNGFAPLPEGVRAALQQENDKLWVSFAQMVEAGRGGKITAERALQLEAGVFIGEDAVRKGLADQVGEARGAFAALIGSLNTASPVSIAASAVTVAPGASALTTPELQHAADAVAALTTGSSGCISGPPALSTMETQMSNDVKTPAADQQPAQTPAANTSAPSADVDAARTAERELTRKISAKIDGAGVSAATAAKLRTDLIGTGVSYEAAVEKILDAKVAEANDGGDIRAAGSAIITMDGHDKMVEGMRRSLMGKVRLSGGERNEFTSMTLREMARAVLVSQGGSVPAGGVMALASAAFVPAMAGAAHSTSDFGNILADIAHKSMLKGFDEIEESYPQFTSVGVLTDFKPHKRVGLDAFPALKEVKEGAEFTYGSIGDRGETALLATYGRLFAITRQTIINDDLDMLSKVPAAMGRAAKRTVGDLVFAILTGNPNMSDGTALFHADHNNLASSGAGPSELTVNAGITAMGTHKDRSDTATALNIRPKFGLSGHKWRSAWLQTLNSEYAPDDTDKAGTAKQPRAYNTVRDAVEPIVDARLTGDEWFLLADPSMHDGIEVGYLDGVDTPFLDQQDGWSVDGTEFKVRIDAAATPMAWETMYKNPGS
ncbi:MAG: hypothetical protein CML02_02450 [Pseudooceanicola sp.]|nr:hypothetical protein [Pseudooceanicola sp.]